MRLQIENIAKVRKANIKLNGLTVIAGENSSGKSTVGKILYSTIRAIADARDDAANHRMKVIDKQVTSLYTRLNGSVQRYRNQELKELFPLISRGFTKSLLEAENAGVLEEKIKQLTDAIQELPDVTPRIKLLIKKDLDNIFINIRNKDNRAATVQTMMEYSIESEFMNNICSYGYNHSSVQLFLDESDKAYLNLQIKNEEVDSVKLSPGNPLSDATYVESPLYLHMLGTLLNATTFREGGTRFVRRSMLPIHIKDLAEKIDALRILSPAPLFSENLQIQDIIKGEFRYDRKKRSLVFQQKDKEISPINVASGIKSFGLVQMLMETNAIDADKILIWDEPENHLHPQWQILFAKLLIQLSKIGIPVVVSTHSPYFVQGIRFFAAQQDVEPFVNYYLAEEGEDNLSELREVTDNLNDIFIKLSKPLNEIMNVDLARMQKGRKND